MRNRLVAGNWKMHGSKAANPALLEAVATGAAKLDGAECAVCVPYPYLAQAAALLQGTKVALGAQNASEHAQGAFTGEVSAAMLADFGCRYVLVGHSERRQLYGEGDGQVAAWVNGGSTFADWPTQLDDVDVCAGDRHGVADGALAARLSPYSRLARGRRDSTALRAPPTAQLSVDSACAGSWAGGFSVIRA
jgi:hypothetical protein